LSLRFPANSISLVSQINMKVASLFTLCAHLTEGARVQVHNQNDAGWGRTCESLETRFTQQGTRLRELEGTRALMGSISLMRTLRRANARECSWIQDGDVDVSAISELAGSYLQQSPCFEQSRSAIQEAQNLPEEERENAVTDGLAILFSDHEDCSPDGVVPPELGDTSDDTLEEEMDDTTDNIMEVMVSHQESSLIQEDSGPGPLCTNPLSCAFLTSLSNLIFAGAQGGPIVLVGVLLFMLIAALFCGAVMHALVRMFRWMRCNLSGNSCEEYAPATWLRTMVRGGCAITSLLYGPRGGILAIQMALAR